MNITDILDEYRVSYRRHGEDRNVRAGWIGLHCPWCGRGEDAFYLGWSIEKRFFACWSCGYLRSWETLAELCGITVAEAGRLLGSQRPSINGIDRKPRGKLILPDGIGPMQRAHREYLRDRRRLDPDHLERVWELQGIGIAARLAWRIFIPIMVDGHVVSWTTRMIGDREPRYISAMPREESVHHKHVCYGQDYVRHRVIVHEGPTDVYATGPGAVATLGVGFTAEQVLWLSRIPHRFVCFDNEPAAQRRARQLVDQLAGFPGETANVVLDANDAASATLTERRKLRRLLD
jgi:hypothetical protein